MPFCSTLIYYTEHFKSKSCLSRLLFLFLQILCGKPLTIIPNGNIQKYNIKIEI